MAIFLFTEVMLFCGLVSGYLVLRSQAGMWPPVDQPRLPVIATAFNTALLLISGGTMWLAVRELARDNRHRVNRLLTMTVLLGVAFVIIQGLEWVSLVRFGLTTSSSLYGSLFYTLVGCHGLHVVAAVISLTVMAWRCRRKDHSATDHDGMKAMRLYWIFVVAIWPPLYALVYLW